MLATLLLLTPKSSARQGDGEGRYTDIYYDKGIVLFGPDRASLLPSLCV